MMYGILGSGFGLYGYLPAVAILSSKPVLLPLRYRSIIASRSDIYHLLDNIEWRSDEDGLLEDASNIVIAKRPQDQLELVSKCASFPRIDGIILEKPLANSPELSQRTFDNLIVSGKKFRISYLFCLTKWAELLLSILSSKNNLTAISIEWKFLAHHYVNDLKTWKRFHYFGGGALRFYGIHLIALLAEIGYQDVNVSEVIGTTPGEVESWKSEFSGNSLPRCNVLVDSRSCDRRFVIKLHAGNQSFILMDSVDPFIDSTTDGELNALDRRVTLVSKLCKSLHDDNENPYSWYAQCNSLWNAVEKRAGIA